MRIVVPFALSLKWARHGNLSDPWLKTRGYGTSTSEDQYPEFEQEVVAETDILVYGGKRKLKVREDLWQPIQ